MSRDHRKPLNLSTLLLAMGLLAAALCVVATVWTVLHPTWIGAIAAILLAVSAAIAATKAAESYR